MIHKHPKSKLWSLVSLYIRLKNADKNGYCTCVTCGVTKHYKEMFAGHFVPKNKGLYCYFDERNIHIQCCFCNVFLHGNLIPYTQFMLKTYGEEVIKELQTYKRVHYSSVDYEAMIQEYQKKLKKYKQ